jgi:hypothetical protein
MKHTHSPSIAKPFEFDHSPGEVARLVELSDGQKLDSVEKREELTAVVHAFTLTSSCL